MFALTEGPSIRSVRGSTSANTGVAPACKTASAVATNVMAGTITSSPGPTPAALNARDRASVPEAQPAAALTLCAVANCCSKVTTHCPPMNLPLARASENAASSWGRNFSCRPARSKSSTVSPIGLAEPVRHDALPSSPGSYRGLVGPPQPGSSPPLCQTEPVPTSLSGHRSLVVAVLGLGYWGPKLVRNLLALPGCSEVRVCDLSPSRMEAVKTEFPAVVGYSDPDAVSPTQTLPLYEYVATPLVEPSQLVRRSPAARQKRPL